MTVYVVQFDTYIEYAGDCFETACRLAGEWGDVQVFTHGVFDGRFVQVAKVVITPAGKFVESHEWQKISS